jgi:hypothetical protein
MSSGYKVMQVDKYYLSHSLYGDLPYMNRIDCYSGGIPFVSINSYKKGLAPKSKVSFFITGDFQEFELNCENDRYQEIIETFRYEKPLYMGVIWDRNSMLTRATVSTSAEPVGEQEGSGAPPA